MKKQKVKKNHQAWLVGLAAVAILVGALWAIDYHKTGITGAAVAEPAVTAVNEKIVDETVALTSFPLVKPVSLSEGRYTVSFEAEKKVRLTAYNEARYQEWLSSGQHTMSKISTQHGSECCAVSGGYTIDINDGEAGTYYFVFEDWWNLKSSSSKLVINKIGEMGR